MFHIVKVETLIKTKGN